MAERLRRKDLKGPDEFVSGTQRAIEYAQEHPREVALAVIGVVLLFVVALSVRAYRDSQIAAASSEFGDVYTKLEAEALDEAAKGFRNVASEWEGQGTAAVARAYAANVHVMREDPAEARSDYEALLRESRDPLLRQIALYNLGLLDRSAGDSESATQRFQEAASLDGPLTGVARLASEDFRSDGEIPEGISAEAQEYLESLQDSGSDLTTG